MRWGRDLLGLPLVPGFYGCTGGILTILGVCSCTGVGDRLNRTWSKITALC